MSGYAQYKNRVKISERHGSGEWVVERVTLLALIPLGVWTVFSVFTLAGADYDAVMAWKVIIEDYIHRPNNKALLLGLSNLIFLVLAAAGVFLITRLALGSAPLPAGFGA